MVVVVVVVVVFAAAERNDFAGEPTEEVKFVRVMVHPGWNDYA